MPIIRLQGDREKEQNIYYEFDSSSTPLGEGGMGKVYRGRRINMYSHETRDVAIKFMFAGLPPNVIQRAEDEASIRIVHENLVEMMGFLAIETHLTNGTTSVRYHVVSELLNGVALSDLMQGVTTDQSGRPIAYAQQLYQMHNTQPEQFAVTVTKKVLSGIMALHDAGYIHRDIDPSNIMVTSDGKIKLIDFGIAKKVDGLKTRDRNLTTAGQFMGKPQYAAPELIVGDLNNQNKPTDIYAIGIMLYQLATGHLPFEGPSNVVLNAHLRNKLPLKAVHNKALRQIIARATEKDCTKRYQTAAEFRAALDSLTSGTASGPALGGKLPLILGAVAGVVLVAVLTGVGISMLGGDKESKEEKKEIVTEAKTDVSVAPISSDMAEVREKLLKAETAGEGFEELRKLSDQGDVEAMFVLSRLYAVSVGSFTLADDILVMQANLKGQVSPDPAKAHQMLVQIIKKNPDFYPALYELGCNYYEGPALTGGEARDLRSAKVLFDRAAKAAKEANDPVFINKISAMLSKY